MSTRHQILVDEDLTLEQLTIDDAHALFKLVDTHRTTLSQWMSWPASMRSESMARKTINQACRQAERGQRVLYGVRAAGTLVGALDYELETQHRVATIGYWLSPKWWGSGMMTRAVRYAITHLFLVEKMNRVQLFCAVENLKSRAIPERLGLRAEGVMRQREMLNGEPIDQVVYAALAEEWS